MTVSSQFAAVEYAGDGSTKPFSTWNSGNGFAYENTADVKVYLRVDSTGIATLQTITTHYTLSASGLPSGGTCTMVTAPAVGETLVLVHDPAIDQQADYVESGKFPAETHERALDRLTHIALKLNNGLDRSLKLPDGSAATGSVYDANSNRIENLSNAVNDQDAVPLAQMLTQSFETFVDLNITYITGTPSDRDLALTDANKVLLLQNSNNNFTLTIPPNSSVAFPIGTMIQMIGQHDLANNVLLERNASVGFTFIAGEPGISLGTTGLVIRRGGMVTIMKYATDFWLAWGNSGAYEA